MKGGAVVQSFLSSCNAALSAIPLWLLLIPLFVVGIRVLVSLALIFLPLGTLPPDPQDQDGVIPGLERSMAERERVLEQRFLQWKD